MTSDAAAMRQTPRKRSLFTALAFVAVTAVATLSFLPGEDKQVFHTRGRFHSWGHLLAFSAIGFLVGRTTHSDTARLLFFFLSVIFGLGIEFGEHLIFHNPLEWKDVLVDVLGVICGTLAAMATAPSPVDPGPN